MHSKRQKPEQQTLPLEVVRFGGEEMNLVEYPFASLWGKEEPGAKIEHEWETRHPITGRTVKAIWRVEGSTELGLPGPSDERLYLALMELSREQGLARQAVTFTRHDLVKRLGWPHNQHSYRMVLDGFRRLKSVAITSENAFWDASIKSFRNVGFGVIDNYDIVTERPGRKKKGVGLSEQRELPLSYFRWNEVIFNSVQAGYIRSLDVGFALSLRGDVALRLFRYLDKKAYDGRHGYEIELRALCDRHLGMKPTQYDSTRRARLKAAHDELLQRGFLRAVVFAPMKTRKAEKVCYSFGIGTRREVGALPQQLETPKVAAVSDSRSPATPAPDASLRELGGVPAEQPFPQAENHSQELETSIETGLMSRMTALGVSSEVARVFAQTVPAPELTRQLDCLNDRRAKDTAAVFVKAVRERWEVPGKYWERLEAAEQVLRAEQSREAALVSESRRKATARERDALAQEEAARLDTLWERLDEPTRQRIEEQARHRLGVLGQAGRAPAALLAMRRTLQRELLKPAEPEK